MRVAVSPHAVVRMFEAAGAGDRTVLYSVVHSGFRGAGCTHAFRLLSEIRMRTLGSNGRSVLSAEDIRRIEQAIPADAVAGERYAVPVMTTLDSER